MRIQKRLLDVTLSALAFLILSPFILVIMLLVRTQLGRPIFFVQTRPGLRGKPFDIYKFRTMKHLADPSGQLMPDGQRLTPFGRFLRSTSLDELPELYNVLIGNMSLVGPRPLLMEYLDRYSPEQARRHDVLPGITGWAQVNGRNALSWEEKFKLDVWYVDNWSCLLDIKILCLTVIKVLSRHGISSAGHATAPEFKDPYSNSTGDRQL